MNGFIRLMCLGLATLTMTLTLTTLVGCVGGGSQNDNFDLDSDLDAGSDTLAEADAPKANAVSQRAAVPEDDFSDFDSPAADTPAAEPSITASADTAHAAPTGNDDDLTLEDEITQPGDTASAPVTPPAATDGLEEDPFADPPAQSMEVQTPPAEVPAPEIVPEPPVQSAEITPPAPVEPAPPIETPAPVVSTPMAPTVEITGLRYQANESGGTVVVQANGPLTFTTRTNPDLKQFIIEVENARLPKKLTRSLNTKDIRGTIGTVDAYQNPGSNTARFVIQLREGASEPAVQAEGNSLLIAASHGSEPTAAVGEVEPSSDLASGHGSMSRTEKADSPMRGGSETFSNVEANAVDGDDKILPSQNLAEFMAGNTRFYGKRISIETDNMDVRTALKFITDETGVNMVIADEVRGNLSLKLRQVPWDQALIMIMKARKLGYSRQGSVLRIAPLADLKQEEDDAAKIATSRKGFEPLKVRMFPVSYAKVEDLEKKIKDFLSERGKAVGDARTNSLVVTDLEDNLSRVAKLISSLDTQPPQVLIEGKIVEANENFTRQVGVNWSASGDSIKIGASKRGPVNMRPNLSVGQGQGGVGPLVFGVNIGTLDIFGNLAASLSLNEREDNVKVISSPRIVTLTNEKADITTTQEIPLTTITQVNGTTQQTVQFKPLTLKLEVTPQVTADASVIMNILVNRQFLGANAANLGDTQLPVNSREAKTKVLVRNGQTAVIGGIYQSDASESAVGVPWFKDVPYIGNLFKTTDKRKGKVELLIFLTPRILGQNETNSTPTSAKDF